MATKVPRIAFTPTLEVRAALDRFAAVSGISPASFVASLLADSVPVIDAMAEAYQQARKAPLEAAETLRRVTHTAMVNVAQEQLRFDTHARRHARLRRTTKKAG